MTVKALEQELEDLIQFEDYSVIVAAFDGSFKLTLLYLPRLSVRGEGGWSYIANGKIGEEWFRGRRRWRKAKKWTLGQIKGHRELLATVKQA